LASWLIYQFSLFFRVLPPCFLNLCLSPLLSSPSFRCSVGVAADFGHWQSVQPGTVPFFFLHPLCPLPNPIRFPLPPPPCVTGLFSTTCFVTLFPPPFSVSFPLSQKLSSVWSFDFGAVSDYLPPQFSSFFFSSTYLPFTLLYSVGLPFLSPLNWFPFQYTIH